MLPFLIRTDTDDGGEGEQRIYITIYKDQLFFRGVYDPSCETLKTSIIMAFFIEKHNKKKN